MIWPNDAIKLAYTKLRTRRIRLGIVIFISSLLFIGVASALFLVRGTLSTVESYINEGLGSRYIVGASPNYNIGFSIDATITARVKELQKDTITRKTAEAKRLGIEYDPKSEPSLTSSFDGPNGKQESITNNSAPEVLQAYKEYYTTHPLPGIDTLKKQANSYNLKDSYISNRLSMGQSGPPYVQVLEGGIEKFGSENNTAYYGNTSNLKDFSTTWQTMSTPLLQPFILSGQNLAMGKDGSIPILAPYSVLPKLLGVKEQPKTTSSKQKLEYLSNIRNKAAGYTFTMCYRNSSSANLVNQAISQQQELLKNKKNKDYVKPDIIYDVPDKPCGDTRVVRDVRNYDQKTLDQKQLKFRQTFEEEAPQTSLLTFRVVGIVPDQGSGTSSTMQQILQGILSTSVGNGWFTPNEVRASSPLVDKLFTPLSSSLGQEQYFIELKDSASAKRFLDEQSCSPDQSAFTGGSPTADFKPYKDCEAKGKYFSIYSFGSNSLAITEFKKTFNKVFRYVVIGIMVLASIILMGVVARVVADSRRETAVFRAIGAKRLDIGQIYLTYVYMISSIISAISIFGAVVICQLIQQYFASDARIATAVAFNATDTSRVFHFYKLAPQDILFVIGVIFVVGFISTLLPLTTNLRRNPIRDMRDER